MLYSLWVGEYTFAELILTAASCSFVKKDISSALTSSTMLFSEHDTAITQSMAKHKTGKKFFIGFSFIYLGCELLADLTKVADQSKAKVVIITKKNTRVR